MRKEGGSVQLQYWQGPDGTPALPFFTSLRALPRAVKQGASYLRLNARTLLEATRGARLVIHPRSQWGKELLPEPGLQEHVVEKETQVLLGQPAQYPHALVQALSTLFSKLPQVHAAYLGLIYEQGAPGLPRLLIGVHAEGDFALVLHQTSSIIPDSVEPGTLVDFLQLQPGESGGVAGYLTRETTPFCRRGVVTELQARRFH